MICPKCRYEPSAHRTVCPRCGLVFTHIVLQGPIPIPTDHQSGSSLEPSRSVLEELLLPIPSDPNILIISGRCGLLMGLLIWGVLFIFAGIETNYAGRSVMHFVNLPFHEAGHLLFSPFGTFMRTLGGSLFQLIIPAICMVTLLIRVRDPFGAAVAQWWLAESFMDIAPYINDARAMKLILLGGFTGEEVVDYHDWEYILGRLDLLWLDHFLAYTAQSIGIILMLSSLIWAGVNLWRQYCAWRHL